MEGGIRQHSGMRLGITERIHCSQPPEAQADHSRAAGGQRGIEARIEALERQAKGKTPQNSSCARRNIRTPGAAAETKIQEETWAGQNSAMRNTTTADSNRPVRRRATAQTDRMADVVDESSRQDPEPLRHQVWKLPRSNRL